jgi:2-iminobutanoate/2-iminopropanoate deaminase
MHTPIQVKDAPPPAGPYSPGVKAGKFIYTSGQLGFDKELGALVEGIEAQTKKAFENVIGVLQSAGAALEDVVKVMVFLDDMENFGKMNEIYATYFSGSYPARSCVQVAKLPLGGMVEIEMIAIKE